VRFGGVVALDDVDLEVPVGAIVGLVGPNGAGKSTLFAVLSGLLRPTTGEVQMDGQDITGARPQDRASRGLARTFQHPELFAGLSVRDHLVLAHRAKSARRRVWSDLFTMGSLRPGDDAEQANVDGLIDLLDLGPIAGRPAAGLPLGQARMVELGRALASSPTVLLLDEPSSGLDSGETDRFEATLRQVCSERPLSVLLVEHDVDLVMRLSETVTVLDFGSRIACGPPAAVRSDPAVRAAYLGEEPSAGPEAGPRVERIVDRPDAAAPSRPSPGAGSLVVASLRVSYGDAVALQDISFELPSGRALAVLGANGAGKSTLARAISGLVPPSSGRIEIGGEDVTAASAHSIRRKGLIHLPEGRGIFRSLTVVDNLRMAAAVAGPRAARREAVDRALEIFPALGARRRQSARVLSGGEQQMLSLARALATSPSVLVADELSLGLAPQMVDLVFDGLERARSGGVTVLMIEQYVHRALGFADDCLVLQRGRMVWHGRAAGAQGDIVNHYLGDSLTAAS
jgi:branched-chain amino acid transport system ATP-binding protein